MLCGNFFFLNKSPLLTMQMCWNFFFPVETLLSAQLWKSEINQINTKNCPFFHQILSFCHQKLSFFHENRKSIRSTPIIFIFFTKNCLFLTKNCHFFKNENWKSIRSTPKIVIFFHQKCVRLVDSGIVWASARSEEKVGRELLRNYGIIDCGEAAGLRELRDWRLSTLYTLTNTHWHTHCRIAALYWRLRKAFGILSCKRQLPKTN